MKLRTGLIALISLVTAAVAVAGFSSRADAGEVSFAGTWGSAGAGDGQLELPFGLAVDSSGNTFVADFLNDRVQKFSPSGAFLLKWGTTGTGNLQFNRPQSIAIDPTGNIYVVDSNNHRISKFTSTGQFLLKWGKNGGDGTSGANPGEFNSPRGIAADSAGNVYVADALNHRIQKFSSTGAFLTQWGTFGAGSGGFSTPSVVAVGPGGHVYVADGTDLIQRFDTNGTFLNQWGGSGSGPGQVQQPNGLATDRAGNLYVSDFGNDRIQRFTANGAFVAAWGTTGAGPGNLKGPRGVAVDGAGNVYVSDSDNDRIVKFAQFGSITVVLDAAPNDAQDFGMRIGGVPFALDDDTDPGLPHTATFSGLPTNFYDLEQVVTPGWNVTDVTCTSSAFPDVAGRSVTVALAPGADVTCTFESSKDLQPDAGIAKVGADPIGHGTVNDTGAGQRITQAKKPKQTVAFDVEIVNEGAFSESFTLDADPAAAGFNVKYLINGSDLTSAVVAGSQTIGPLAPGATEVVQVKAKVRNSAVQGQLNNGRLLVASNTLPDQVDVVKPRVRVK